MHRCIQYFVVVQHGPGYRQEQNENAVLQYMSFWCNSYVVIWLPISDQWSVIQVVVVQVICIWHMIIWSYHMIIWYMGWCTLTFYICTLYIVHCTIVVRSWVANPDIDMDSTEMPEHVVYFIVLDHKYMYHLSLIMSVSRHGGKLNWLCGWCKV